MSNLKVKEFALDKDLSLLHKVLTAQSIPHRFCENDGKQELWILNGEFGARVHTLVEAFEAGELTTDSADLQRGKKSQTWTIKYDVLPFPTTLIVVLLGIVGYLLIVNRGNSALFEYFLFVAPRTLLTTGEIWRLITPVFLHFSLLHILFNALWVWELGRRLEMYLGRWTYVLLILSIGIGSNYIQFYAGGGNIIFGGLSGVVYGLLGFLLVARIGPDKNSAILRMPTGIFVFMIAWLILGFIGVIDIFIDGSIANGAHLGGLLIGVAAALVYFFGVKLKGAVK